MLTICFYRAASGTLLSEAIDECSGRDGYSHVALRFEDGRMFASDPGNGTGWHPFDYCPGHWDFVHLPTTEAQGVSAANWCNAHNGLPYAYLADAAFLLPVAPRSGLFCSEVGVLVLQEIGLVSIKLDAARVSPNTLFLILAALGY